MMIERLSPVLPSGWRFERKQNYSTTREFAFKILGVMIALGITAIMIAVLGQSPLTIVGKIIKNTFGTPYGLQQLLILTTPHIICAVAFVLCDRMHLFNIGLEGQLYFGAWAATGIGLFLKGPTPLILVLMMLAGALGGALFILIPAWLRIKAGVSEVLTTLLLNFVAVFWVQYFVVTPWKHKEAWSHFTQTSKIEYELPYLWGGLHIGILIAIILVVLLYVILEKTAWGYEIRTIGGNRRVATYAGMPVLRHMFTVMLLSGAIAGLSGAIEVAGVAHRLHPTISTNYGFNSVLVGLIAGTSIMAIIPAGLFIALIMYAGIILNTQGIPIQFVTLIIGLILLFVCLGEWMANYRLVQYRKGDFAEDQRIAKPRDEKTVVER